MKPPAPGLVGPIGLILLAAAPPAVAADDPTDVEFFELHVRPLLVEKCGSCHIDSDEGGLLFTGREALVTGGDFGPAIEPGHAAKSLLLAAVKWTTKDLRMPPEEDERLTPAEIASLERWIDRGAVWPGGAEAPAAAAGGADEPDRIASDHWAFQPIERPEVPDVADPEWAGSPIDAFIHAGHVAGGVAPAPRADRLVLLRRATFDLLGLPPTPEEIAAFAADTSADAFPRAIDRLLASPHYGERWGRHWLDVARYADTAGDVGDYPIPTARLYRDWVIDSLNADLPIDRFLEAQIAGDLLAASEPVPTADPTAPDDAAALRHRRDLSMATGFISLSRRFGNTKAESMHLTIEDTIDTVGRGMLGLTLRCARCHDHKFDPLLATDYYRLYGIFASTRYPWMGMSVEKSPAALVPLSLDPDAPAKADAYWDTIARYEYQINNHHRPWLKPALAAFTANEKARAAAGDDDRARRADLDRRREELLAAHDGKFRELMLHGLDWLKAEKQRLAANPPFPMLYAVSEGQPADARLHRRGNPELLGDAVPRGMPEVVAGDHPPTIAADAGTRPLACFPVQPAHRPGLRESRLAPPLRPRPGGHARQLRHSGRAAEPSGTARLAGRFVHGRWLVAQAAPPPDPALAGLAGGRRRRAGSGGQGPGQRAGLAASAAAAGGRGDPRHASGRGRHARPRPR